VSPTPMYAIVTYILSMPSNYLGKKMTVWMPTSNMHFICIFYF
jgi:hypothetical protein